MRISFNTAYNNRPVPQFKSQDGFYITENKREMGIYTWFFRSDIDWNVLSNYMLKHFASKRKVNLVQFGASDGSEAYTQIISLLETNRPKDTAKFFPMQAYDIKDTMVKVANSGMMAIEPTDKTRLGRNCQNWHKYFEVDPEKEENILCENEVITSEREYFRNRLLTKTYQVKPILREKVNFQEGDMFNLISEIKDSSNTVVYARNSLGYFDLHKVYEFIKTAGEVLKKGSLFCIGKLEAEESHIIEALNKNGFKNIIPNVFQKF